MPRREQNFFYIKPALFFTVVFFILCNVSSIQAEESNIQPENIIISEIMINPKSVKDTDGEWLEIYNNTESDLNLINCTFKDNGTNEFQINGDLIISGNDFLVLGKNDDIEINGGLNIDFVYTSFTLANTEDEIILICDEIEIDKVEYSKDLDFKIPEGKSIFVIDYSKDNNSADNWCESTSEFGSGDFGTPGGPNDACELNNEEDDPPDIPKNNPPIAEAGEDIDANTNQEIIFDASESYDIDEDTLIYTWNFGDGNTTNKKISTHSYEKENVYLVVLTVDDGMVTQTDSLTVIVSNNQTTSTETSIIINELLPNPAGSDNGEWIELKNTSDKPANVEGYKISDATDKKYTIKSEKIGNTTIPANGFLLIYKNQSKISLNNTKQETVRLYSPNDKLIDETTYSDTAKENISYANFDGIWDWTTILTPGNDNILARPKSSKQDIKIEKNSNPPAKESTSTEITSEQIIQIENECQKENLDNIIINELWPSPEGDDREKEFIELKNLNNFDVNICGWQLTDRNHKYILPNNSFVAKNDFLLISRQQSRISLNNAGDTISLFDSADKLIEEVNFSSAKTNLSWSKNKTGAWKWTSEVTPAEENIFLELIDEKNQKAKTNSKNKNYYQTINIDEINNYPAGQKFIIQGLVTAPPGVLGTQIMYISGSRGLQIYQYKKDWPNISLNDFLEIKGELSYAYGAPRLKVKNKSDIILLNKQTEKIEELSITEIMLLDDSMVGALIKVGGEVIEKSSNKIFIDDGSGEIEIYIKSSTGISLPEIKEGDILEATGILTKSSNKIKIFPRYLNDLKVVSVKGWSNDSKFIPVEIKKDNFIQITNFLFVTCAGIIIILISQIYKLKQKRWRKKSNQK